MIIIKIVKSLLSFTFSKVLAVFKYIGLFLILLGMFLGWPVCYIFRKIKNSHEDDYR